MQALIISHFIEKEVMNFLHSWLILLNIILFPPTDQTQFILCSAFRLTWKGVWIRPLLCSKQRHGMYRNAILVSRSSTAGFGFNLLLLFFFWPCHTACGILVPWPGIEIMPLAVKAQSPNQWTVREVPQPPRCVPQDSLPWTSSPTLCYVSLWIQLIFSPSLGTSAYNPMVNYIWDANKKVLYIFN